MCDLLTKHVLQDMSDGGGGSGKRKKHKYSSEDVEYAARAVRDSEGALTLRNAEKQFNIPRMVIQRCLKNDCTYVGKGRPTLLDTVHEKQLAKYCEMRAGMNCGVTKQELMRKARALSKEVGVVKPWNNKQKDVDAPLSYEWYNGFEKRNKMSHKKPQGLDTKRYCAFTKDIKAQTFDLYIKLLSSNDLLDAPAFIWNFDEKCQRLTHRPKKVVARKGQQIDCVVSANRESFTVVLMCNADGVLLPPCFIVSGKTDRCFEKWGVDGFKEAYWTRNESGYSTNETQLKILQDYMIPNMGTHRPQVILSDGFSSHEFLDSIEELIDNRIHLFCFPSHSTSKLQPIDKYITALWNKHWDNMCAEWFAKNPNRELSHHQCTKLLKSCYEHISRANVRACWRDCRLYPISPDLVSADVPLAVESEVELTHTIAPGSPAPLNKSADNSPVSHMPSQIDQFPGQHEPCVTITNQNAPQKPASEAPDVIVMQSRLYSSSGAVPFPGFNSPPAREEAATDPTEVVPITSVTTPDCTPPGPSTSANSAPASSTTNSLEFSPRTEKVLRFPKQIATNKTEAN